MFYKVFNGLVLFALLHTQVQAVYRISGAVEDVDGFPVKDAIVVLHQSNIITKTDSLGHFQIIPTAMKNERHYTEPNINASIHGKTLVINLAQATKVVATIFDLKGRRIARPVNALLSEGKHTFLLDEQGISSGKHIVSLTIGNENRHYVLSSDGLLNIPQSINSHVNIAKTSTVDTLEILKTNYISRKIPIISDTILNIKIARSDTVSTGVKINFINTLQCVTPVRFNLHLSGDHIDTTLKSVTLHETLWPTFPLGECVNLHVAVYGAGDEKIAEGYMKQCPVGSDQIITIPTTPSINAVISQIPTIHSGAFVFVNGRIESGLPISNLTFSILDSNGMELQNSNVAVKWTTTSFCSHADLRNDLNLQISTQPNSCSGKYYLKMLIQTPDTIVTIRDPFNVEGINYTAVIKDSAILGSNQNSIYGCSIDIDKNKVFLFAEANANVKDIDLCYAFSHNYDINKIFTPYETCKAQFDFSKNWVNPPITKFMRLGSCNFDTITTAEQIEALWNDSLAEITSFPVYPNDVFIVNTTEGKYVLIRVKQMEFGPTGMIKIDIARKS